MAAEGEMSTTPKFVPPSVSVAPPVNGLFTTLTIVTTGLLYENAPAYVPTTLAIVTGTSRATPEPGGATTVRDEVVVHVAVTIRVTPMMTVGVTSSDPKLLPCTVRGAPPDVGAFLVRKLVTIGASNVTNCWALNPAVPTNAVIVNATGF